MDIGTESLSRNGKDATRQWARLANISEIATVRRTRYIMPRFAPAGNTAGQEEVIDEITRATINHRVNSTGRAESRKMCTGNYVPIITVFFTFLPRSFVRRQTTFDQFIVDAFLSTNNATSNDTENQFYFILFYFLTFARVRTKMRESLLPAK